MGEGRIRDRHRKFLELGRSYRLRNYTAKRGFGLCLTCSRNMSRMLVWFRERNIRVNYDAIGRDGFSQNYKAMKLIKISQLMVLGLALTLTAVGCRKHPYDPNTIYGQKHNIAGHGPNDDLGNGPGIARSPHDIGAQAEIPPLMGGGPMLTNHTGWPEDHEALKAQTVYFDFDKSTIKPGEVSKLNSVVDYLKSHQNAAVRVEGNCDERGTEEYNRSLGERRALASREKIVAAGIDPNRVDTVSYGQDHPVEAAHNEAAWSKNRRDDFTVLTPPH